VEPPAVVEEEQYVPGKSLQQALNRLRSGIYPSEKRIAALPRKSSEKDVNGKYEPGALLTESLEKIRSQREIFRMIKLIKAASAVHNLPIAPDTRPGNAGSSMPAATENQAQNMSDCNSELKQNAEPVQPVAAHSSAQLLKAAETGIRRSLVHKDPVALPKASPSGKNNADPEEKNQQQEQPAARNEDESDINAAISRFEYKMPSNYRIIVR
jgi:hypothetical protein